MSNAVQYPTMATVKDAAAKFGISEYFLRNLCRAGKVRFVCVGNRWLVNLDSLQRGRRPGGAGKPSWVKREWSVNNGKRKKAVMVENVR